MLTVFTFILGLITPFLPSTLFWFPFVFALQKPRYNLLALIAGASFMLLQQRQPIADKKYNVKVIQISHKIHHRANLQVITPDQCLKAGDILHTKLASNFYQKNANCQLTCHKTRNNSNGYQLASKWYYKSQNIVAECREIKCNISSKKQSNLRLDLEKLMPNNLDNISIFKALLLGQAYLIPSQVKQLFKFAGLAHLIAVSGLHIGLIASIFGSIFGLLWRLCLKLFWRIPKNIFVMLGNVIGATTYTWVSGFGDASCRALAMIIIARISQNCFCRWSGEQILMYAILAIVLVRPYSVFSLGLWLSAVAVWSLIKSGNSLIRSQINITIGMLPFQAMMAWPLGWWMPIVNLIAIPLFSIVILPTAFFAWFFSLISRSFAQDVWIILDRILSYFFLALNLLKDHVGSGYVIPINSLLQILILAVLAFYLINKNYISSIILAILFYFMTWQKIQYGSFKAEVMAVGQGLAILVRTKNHNILYDTGSEQMGRNVVLPTLKQYGISMIDKIIVSHGDHDHSGGLKPIVQSIAYKQIIAGEPERLHLKSNLCQNTSWEWDGVVFSSFRLSNSKRHNNLSCILHIQAKNKALLIPGDIESDAEQEILRSVVPGSLHADILIAPHHGSISSSSHNFIREVAPSLIVVSAGSYALYKHPAKAHVSYWQKKSIRYLNTNFYGSVCL